MEFVRICAVGLRGNNSVGTKKFGVGAERSRVWEDTWGCRRCLNG